MASSSMYPTHPSNTQDNHKRPLQKAVSASKGSKWLEDESTGNKSSLGFHCLDYDSANHFVKRVYWDLNVPMEQWVVNASCEHGMDNKSIHGVMHEQKTERCVQSDLTLEAPIIEKRRCSLLLRNLELPADNARDYEGGLELQLRPPCRPELRIRWGNKSPPHLSLSLTGTLSEVSCSPVKPESSSCSREMETETACCNISTSVGNGDVKSELCDGSFQVETSKEFEGNLVSCTKSTPSKVILVVPNVEATPAVDTLPDHYSTIPGDENVTSNDGQRVVRPESPAQSMLLDDNSDMPCNTNIKSGEGICPAMDRGTLSGSSCKVGDDISSVCTHQHTEESLSKSSDTAEPVHEIPETDVNFATQKIDAAEPMAHDGMSQGSAEMDFSDNEYYSSQVVVAGDVQVDHDETIVPRILSLIGNDQPQGPSGVQDKISIAQRGPIDAEDGTLGDPKPRCASEDSCQHKEEGIHSNVCASEDIPMAHDGMSQGSAEMDFSDNEYYSSQVLVAGDVQVDHDETIVPRILSLIGNDQPQGPSGVQDKISIAQRGPIDAEDGTLGDPKPRCASEDSCQHKEEGIHSNVCASEDIPQMKPKSIKPQSASANNEKTSAAIPPVKIRDAGSLNHPELSERGSNVNGLTIKQTHDEVQQSNRTKKVTSSRFLSSSGQRDPISARSVSTGSEQDKIDDPRRRHWSSHRGKRHSKYFSRRNNHDKHDPYYVNSRRARKLRFHRGAHYRAEFDDSGRHRVRRHDHEEFVIPPNGSVASANGLPMELMDDKLNYSSRFPPNRQLPGMPADGPIYTSHNGRFIGREVHENLQFGHHEMMMTLPSKMVDNSVYPHASLPHYGHCLHQDVIVTEDGPPPCSQLPGDMGQIHPINDVGPVEHLGPAHYAEHLVTRCDFEPFQTPRDAERYIFPYAAHDNGCRPNHFRTDGEASPGRSRFRDFRKRGKQRWHESGRNNLRRKRGRF